MTVFDLRRRAARAAFAVTVLATGCATPRSIEARPVSGRVAVTAGPAADRSTPWITIRQVGQAYAGGVATFEELAANFDAGGGRYEIDYGDGSPGNGSKGADFQCGGRRPGHGPHSEMIKHVYRYPGQWTVTVRSTLQCGDRELETVVGTGVVTVLPADAPSNGPYLPLAMDFAMDCREVRGGQVGCFPQYADEDGYVTSVVLRWGDGSPDTVWEYPLSGCVDPADHWPATPFDEDATDDPWGALHAYPGPGTYRAHVTVTSSGCDGADVQVGTASTRVTVG